MSHNSFLSFALINFHVAASGFALLESQRRIFESNLFALMNLCGFLSLSLQDDLYLHYNELFW